MQRTDWNRYYSSPMPTAFWSRMIVKQHLLKMIRKCRFQDKFSVAELGGGGSCFCESVEAKFQISDYSIYDSCQAGIDSFLRKNPLHQAIFTDLLKLQPDKFYDLVFSVGLIEHFSREETGRIIRKHFEMTKPGGCVILFFPTPTLLYRITRKSAELLHLWQFPDERPLLPEEIRKTADKSGIFINGYTIHTNFLTQYAALYRKT